MIFRHKNFLYKVALKLFGKIALYLSFRSRNTSRFECDGACDGIDVCLDQLEARFSCRETFSCGLWFLGVAGRVGGLKTSSA